MPKDIHIVNMHAQDFQEPNETQFGQNTNQTKKAHTQVWQDKELSKFYQIPKTNIWLNIPLWKDNKWKQKKQNDENTIKE